jgi:hypothetical protein
MFKFIQTYSAKFTVHYEFTVYSAESSAKSADFRVFKKFLFLSLVKCISVEFFQISPNFFPIFVKCDGFACLRIFYSRRIFKH